VSAHRGGILGAPLWPSAPSPQAATLLAPGDGALHQGSSAGPPGRLTASAPGPLLRYEDGAGGKVTRGPRSRSTREAPVRPVRPVRAFGLRSRAGGCAPWTPQRSSPGRSEGPPGVPHTPGASVPSAVSRGRSGAARLRYRTDGFIPTDVRRVELYPTNGAGAGTLSLTAREGRTAPGLSRRPARRPERVPQSRAERSDVAQRGAAPLTVGVGTATRTASARAQRAERQAERSEDH